MTYAGEKPYVGEGDARAYAFLGAVTGLLLCAFVAIMWAVSGLC